MATKLNRFGLALTVAFALGGLLFLLGPFFGLSLSSHPLVGFGWLGIAALMLSRWHRGNTEAARMARIAKNGLRGVATVVSVASGSLDQTSPTLSLSLRLEVPGIEPRQVEHVEQVAAYAAHGIKPGLRLPVVVDPSHLQDLILVW